MNGFPETYSVDPESTGQRPHDQIDNLIDEHEGSSLFNLLSFLTELAPGYSPLERMGEKETFLQKAGEVPTFLMGLGLAFSPGGKVRQAATKLGTKKVLKELGEEIVDPLYHNTSLTNLVEILKEGNLKGAPALGRKHLPSKEGSGISFTRNPRLGTGEAKGTPGERLFQTKYGQAQIMVSKEGIENLGKITKHGPKELSQEVLFSPLKSETKRIQRLPKIPTEKFEGIHISEFMVEAQLPGREYDKATIQYITELMREAHKRKVPIILGPEATETFHNLNMEKKLPKAWLGRLVVDSDQIFFHGGPTKLKELKEGVLFSVSGAQEREHGARIADWGKDVLGKPAARRRKVKPIGGIAESYAEERSWRTSDGGAITALKLKPGVKLATYDEFEKVIKEIGMLDDYMSTTLSSAEWVSDTPLAIKALKDRGYHGVTDLPDFGFRGDFDEITSTMVFNAKESMEILPYSSKLPGS